MMERNIRKKNVTFNTREYSLLNYEMMLRRCLVIYMRGCIKNKFIFRRKYLVSIENIPIFATDTICLLKTIIKKQT